MPATFPGKTLLDSTSTVTMHAADAFDCPHCAALAAAGQGAVPLLSQAALDTSSLDVNALLAFRNGTGLFSSRWNYDKAVGSARESDAGLGTGVQLNYTFLSSPASYMNNSQGSYGSLSNGFRALTADEQSVIRKALGYYSEVADITFTQVPTAVPGTKTLTFSAFDFSANWTGYASYPGFSWRSNPSGIITEITVSDTAGDVFFNTDSWGGAGLTSGTSLKTALHEIGHALGLSHPFSSKTSTLPEEAQVYGVSVMSYPGTEAGNFLWWLPDTQDQNGNWRLKSLTLTPNLGILDVLAVQTLYGANMAYKAGDTTWSFDATQPMRTTLWDAGGVDTIDLSNFTLRSELNLNPGTFSSIGIRSTAEERKTGLDPRIAWATVTYDGRSNLGIAFNVTIENAKGGAGNDAITGNQAANSLAGGAGNDTLAGGAGNDTIAGDTGADWAAFSARMADYSLSSANGVLTVRHLNGGSDGIDSLTGIEYLRFSDIAYDLSSSKTMALPPAFTPSSFFLQRPDGSLLAWDQTKGGNGFVALPSAPAGSEVVSVADFTGDGRADVMLRITATKEFRLISTEASATSSISLVRSATDGFSYVASGYFTSGYEKDSMLLQGSAGNLKFVGVSGTSTSYQDFITLQPGFEVLGAGNIDGTGFDDILFQNTNNGSMLYWNGTSFIDLLTLAPGSGWRVEGIADYTGDAKADLLFYNTNSRVLIFWEPTKGGNGFADFIALDPGWQVGLQGDFNGDGRADILLHNDAARQSIYWDHTGFQDISGVLGAVQLVGVGQFG